MATITKLIKGDNRNIQKGTETEAIYYVVDSLDQKYIQIDTYGSKNRKFNKVSQSIRINKGIALQLIEIFKNNFD